MSPWQWGRKSSAILGRLSAYSSQSEQLVAVCETALKLSPVDLTIIEGLRGRDRQQELVRLGHSRTIHSKHLDGRAVDIAPLVDGRIPWAQAAPWYDLAVTMQAAAAAHGVTLRWGGVWDRTLDQLDPEAIAAEVTAYWKRRKDMGKSAFFDGPHYELAGGAS